MARTGAIDTGRVPSMFGSDCLHGGENVNALLGVCLAFFVAHRPHEDAGMIAIAAHEIRELGQAFGVRRHHARLIEDQHAELIAGLQQLWSGRVMRGADGVTAHLLQLANAVVLHGVGHGDADSGVVLVITGPLHLDGLAVEKEALLRIELERTNAEGRLIAIDDFAVRFNLGDQRVEISLLRATIGWGLRRLSPAGSFVRPSRKSRPMVQLLFRLACLTDREWWR